VSPVSVWSNFLSEPAVATFSSSFSGILLIYQMKASLVSVLPYSLFVPAGAIFSLYFSGIPSTYLMKVSPVSGLLYFLFEPVVDNLCRYCSDILW
jgi:hypothetical protein